MQRKTKFKKEYVVENKYNSFAKYFKHIDNQALIHMSKQGLIFCEDAIDFLDSLKEGIADIIFIDPPFNLGKKYGSRGKREDNFAEDVYLDFLRKIILRSVELLKEGGALYLYHIPQWAAKLSAMICEPMIMRHWIAISMKNGFAIPQRLYPAHYALLYYSKGKPKIFNRPKIKVQTCRHCHKYIKDYGGYKKYIKNGINLSDFWDDISPVRHKKYKHREANELPAEILNRVVTISGLKNALLIDPFAGTGTSLVVAKQAGMKYLGCDNIIKNCIIISKRIDEQKIS